MTSPPQLTNSSTQKLINSQNHQHKNSSVQKLISSQTHQFKNSLTQKLKLLSFILQCCSNFRSVLAKIQAEKSVKNRFLYPFAPLALSIFTPRSCILHHFAFLVWVKSDVFSDPNSCFQPLKPHFLTTILPFSDMFFMALKGFVYTIATYIYSFCLAFSTFLHCVQHHFTLRLAPKYTAFCTKTHCVLRHIARHLAANCTIFCPKQPQKGS